MAFHTSPFGGLPYVPPPPELYRNLQVGSRTTPQAIASGQLPPPPEIPLPEQPKRRQRKRPPSQSTAEEDQEALNVLQRSLLNHVKERQSWQTDRDGLEAEKKRLIDQSVALQEENGVFSNNIEALIKDKEQLVADRDAAERRIDIFRTEKDTQSKAIQALHKRTENLVADTAAQTESSHDRDATLKVMGFKYAASKAKVAHLQSLMATEKAARDQLQHHKEQAEVNFTERENTITSLRGEVHKLINDLNAERRAKETLETQLQQQKTELDGLRMQLDDEQKARKKADDKQSQEKEVTKNLRKELSVERETRKAKEDDWKKSVQAVEGLRDKLTDATNEQECCRLKLGEAIAACAQLRGTVSSTQRLLHDAREIVTSLEDQLAAEGWRVAYLRSDLANSNGKNIVIMEDLAVHAQEMDDLRSKYESPEAIWERKKLKKKAEKYKLLQSLTRSDESDEDDETDLKAVPDTEQPQETSMSGREALLPPPNSTPSMQASKRSAEAAKSLQPPAKRRRSCRHNERLVWAKLAPSHLRHELQPATTAAEDCNNTGAVEVEDVRSPAQHSSTFRAISLAPTEQRLSSSSQARNRSPPTDPRRRSSVVQPTAFSPTIPHSNSELVTPTMRQIASQIRTPTLGSSPIPQASTGTSAVPRPEVLPATGANKAPLNAPTGPRNHDSQPASSLPTRPSQLRTPRGDRYIPDYSRRQ